MKLDNAIVVKADIICNDANELINVMEILVNNGLNLLTDYGYDEFPMKVGIFSDIHYFIDQDTKSIFPTITATDFITSNS